MVLDYYRLSDKPFQLSPDLKFLHPTPGYQEALETVLDGIISLRKVIILTGEAGTGKTMMIHGLMRRLPDHIKTAFIFYSTYNYNEMLHQIFSELGEPLGPEEIIDIKTKFLDLLRKSREGGKVLAVFVDEAQRVSQEVLREFFRLLDGESWISETLQLVLAGQPEFENLFNTAVAPYPGLHSPRRARIPVLSPNESLAYIEHRLNIAGRSSTELFSPQALSAITEYSQGIPRLINVVCDNALFNGYADSLEMIPKETIRKVIRNLEGPGEKITTRAKGLQDDSPRPFWSRVSILLALSLLVVLLMIGTVLLWWQSEKPFYLKSPEKPASVNPRMTPQKGPEKDISTQPETAKPAEIRPQDPPLPSTPISRGESLPPPGEGSPAIHRIKAKSGESLSVLAKRYYGKVNNSLINLIVYYNPGIKKLDLILLDQEIKLPELREEALVIKAPNQGYSIFLGIFANSKMTQPFADQPLLKGKEITVQPNIIGQNERVYRMEAGIFNSRSEALEALKDLRQKNLLPFF
jgi:general secretion pathway protein A